MWKETVTVRTWSDRTEDSSHFMKGRSSALQNTADGTRVAECSTYTTIS